MLVPILIAGGFLLGLIVGRWWALAAPVGVGAWVVVVSEVEVSAWFLGFAYGGVAAVSVAAGVLLRRFASRRAKLS
jgi:hypothetical protein